MSSLFCPCLLVMVQDNNWLGFGQNNTVNTCHVCPICTSACSLEQQRELIIFRWQAAHDGCWCHDVTGNIDTRHCHVSRSVMCHNLTGAAPLMQQQRRRKCWRIGLKMSGQLTRSEEVGTRGLIKDGTIYGEVFVWEIVWSMECGEERREVRRDAGF